MKTKTMKALLAVGLGWAWLGGARASASEFEVVATSFTVDSQINASSVTYFGTKTPANVATPNAANLDPALFPTPGGLYFDGTYYNVWDRVNSAWVKLATGTVKGLLGSGDIAPDSIQGPHIQASTITLNKLNANGCSVGQVVKLTASGWTCGTDVGVGAEVDPTAVHLTGDETVAGHKSFTGGVTASSGTFQAIGAAQYSVATASGVKVNGGGPVDAAFFLGNGRTLTGVVTLDTAQTVTANKTLGNVGIGGVAPGANTLTVGGAGNAQFANAGYVDILGLTVGKVGTVTTLYSGTGTATPIVKIK